MKSVWATGLALLVGLGTATSEARDGRPDRGADYGSQHSGRGESRGDEGRGRGNGGGEPSFERSRGGGEATGWGGGHSDERGGQRGRDTSGVAQPFQQTHGFGADRPRSGGRDQRDYGGGEVHRGGRNNDSYQRHDDRGRYGYGNARHDDHYRDRDRYDRYDRHDRHDRHDRYSHDDWRRPEWRRSWSHGWSGSRYRAPARYVYPRGYSSYSWRVGYQIPLAFLIANYYIDYRPYGLSAPPYGCRWVRVDGDLLLVETRSGEIVDILYDFFY